MNYQFIIVLLLLIPNILLFGQQYKSKYQIQPSGFRNKIYKPNAVIPDFQVNEIEEPRGVIQFFPRVMPDNGDFSVVWIDKRKNARDIFYRQKILMNIARLFGINSNLNDSIEFQSYYNENIFDITTVLYGYVITWVSAESENLFAQRYFVGYKEPDKPIGPIIKVNDFQKPTICGRFGNPSVASTPDGGFIIAFEEMSQGIGMNIYMQRFSNHGAKIGNNIRINDDTTSFHIDKPAISTDANGNFVISWVYNPFFTSSDKNAILAQRFNADGTRIGHNFRVDQDNYDVINYSAPDIALSDSGKFLVVWVSEYYSSDSSETYYRLNAQRYSKDGSKIDSNFVISDNDYLLSQKYSPKVVASKNGGFIVTWVEHRVFPLKADIFVQSIDENGQLIGPNYLVNDARQGDQSCPDITVNSNGYFLIAWDDERNGVGKDIYAQVFNPNGMPRGVNLKLNDDGFYNFDQIYPTIDVDNDGGFIITWTGYSKWEKWNVYAQRYTKDGTAISNNFQVSDRKSFSNRKSAIAIDDSGNFLITWKENNYDKAIYFKQYQNNGNVINKKKISNDEQLINDFVDVGCDSIGNFFVTFQRVSKYSSKYSDIILQRYKNDGKFTGSITVVNDDNNNEPQNKPSIAVNKKGTFVIAWEDSRNNTSQADIYAQMFSNADYGTAIGHNIKVNDDEGLFSHLQPDVDIDNNGNFGITWIDNRNQQFDVFMQYYLADGTLQGNNIKVNDSSINTDPHLPTIAFDNNGKYVIVWASWLNDSWAILGQRFLGNGTRVGNNFLIAKTFITNRDVQILSPDVKLHNNLIYTTWEDIRSDSTGLDIWANVLAWDEIVSIKNEHFNKNPGNFVLSQNYPNPFNPSTTISYTLPKSGNVQLMVYDILGREAATLVNEEKAPGNYKVVFNAEGLPSGIYFYRLTAGDLSISKTMMLLK